MVHDNTDLDPLLGSAASLARRRRSQFRAGAGAARRISTCAGLGPIPNRSTYLFIASSIESVQVNVLRWPGKLCLMVYRRRRRKRFPASPEQLSWLPMWPVSAHADRPQSHARSNLKRPHRWQDRPVTTPAMPALLGIVPVTCETDTKNNRQRQRFSLTPTLSTLISEVNGKRWPYVSALSPLHRSQVAKFSEGRAHVRGRSSGRLPAHPLVRD